jgi:hypothetical protein
MHSSESFLSLSLSLWLYSPPDLCHFFTFLTPYTVSRTPWTGDQPVARPLPTPRTAQTQNKRTQTSTPRVGLEATTPMFELTNTVHALDRAAIVIGESFLYVDEMCGRIYEVDGKL